MPTKMTSEGSKFLMYSAQKFKAHEFVASEVSDEINQSWSSFSKYSDSISLFFGEVETWACMQRDKTG